MNKRLNLFLLLSGLLSMIAGCSEESFNSDTTGNGDIRFDIGFTSAARVATDAEFESTWEKGDAIGIFAYDANNNLVLNNAKVTYDGSEWNSSDGLYWKGKTLKFYAYYPYDATVSDPANITFQVKSDQSGTTGEDNDKQSNYSLSDLMTATNTQGLSVGSTVSLSFKHEFVMIQVEVPAQALGKGLGASENMTVSLKGVQTGATLNLTSENTPTVQTKTETGDVKMYLTGKPGTDGYNNYTYRAVIPVQTLQGGSDLFLISNEGVLYKSSGPDAELELQAEKAVIFTRSLPNDIKNLHRVLIPAGKFMMGDAESIYASMKPVHEVTLSHDFYMTKYEITNAQYAAFLNATGVGEDGKGQVSYPDGKGNEQTEEQVLIKINTDGVNYENGTWKPQDGKDDFPVVCVTWYGAKAYADWVGGSLPTDAQWEYACRAGTTTTYSFGNDNSELGTYAWFRSNSDEKTHEVGTKAPNSWGLYDMHGNVNEWCADWFDYYSDDAVTDPTGPATGSFRIARGGSYTGNPHMGSSTYRLNRKPDEINTTYGFRVVFLP